MEKKISIFIIVIIITILIIISISAKKTLNLNKLNNVYKDIYVHLVKITFYRFLSINLNSIRIELTLR